MPKTSFKVVREVSSEDPNFKAENLLKQTPGKSWKTKTGGEKQAYVILELENPVQITGIDIGNEHSAFIEVLVGKTACTRDDFKEILITCSFMTPFDSRSSENPNRVRCFNQEALVPHTASEKWQMVKIICTQPFNKHVQYGLAFIKLHVAEKVEEKAEKPKSLVPEKFMKQINVMESEKNKPVLSSIKIGKFTLREESPDSESESTNSLFQRWKNKSTTSAPTTAAAIRDASTPAGLKKLSEDQTRFKKELKSLVKPSDGIVNVDLEEKRLEVRDRNRMDLLFGDEEENKDKLSPKMQRLSKQIEQDQERLKRNNEIQQLQNKTPKNKLPSDEKPSTSKASIASVTSNKQKQTLNSSFKEKKQDTSAQIKPSTFYKDSKSDNHNGQKRQVSPTETTATVKKPRMSQIVYKPFNELLKGVVLVISGIQNPDRADLRDKALKMGAKYRGDWDSNCTHLISAFKNTPKYKQVKGQGKIVIRNWIEDCFSAKKYLPWRRFALDNSDAAAPESDVEIWDETLRPVEKESESKQQQKPQSPVYVEDLEKNTNPVLDLTSGDDTEDEIDRIVQKNKTTKTNTQTFSSSRDVFDLTTEEEDYLAEKNTQISTNEKEKKFFSNILFYLYDDVNVVGQIKLKMIITKHGGQLTTDLRKAQYVITENGLTDPSDAVGFTGVAVQPRWIYECDDLEMKVPTQRYII